MSTLDERVRETIATHLQVDLARVTPEKTIMGDLWADSLAAIELISVLEETFDIVIPEQEMPRLRTVGDIISYVGQQVAGAAEPT